MSATEGAACAEHDPELWFPRASARGGVPDWNTPRQICNACPLLADCAEWALSDGNPSNGEGMFGGLSPRQRASIRSKRGVTGGPRPINHGTAGGDRAHRRRGEPSCRACMDASNRAKRERKSA